MVDQARYAIITPYYKEEKWLLERCMRSVRAQTVPADHFLISDGFPQDWIDDEPVRHLKLDCSHADYGNTPRTIGGLLAVSEGYDGIGFLDADNWLEANHISSCIEASLRNDTCDYVIAQRNLCRPDGSIMNADDVLIQRHVDANCLFLLPGSYHVIPHYSLMPIELSPIGDRVFYAALKAKRLGAQFVLTKTVNYHCLWSEPYRRAGEIPPPEATRGVNFGLLRDWLNGQNPTQLEIISRRCGSSIVLDAFTRAPDSPRRDPSHSSEVGAPADVKFRQARQLHQDGKLGQAELLYQAILAADPDNANALHFLGVIHAQRSDYETAADLIAQSITVAPENAIAHYNLGKALRDGNRHEEALRSYDRAIALMPTNCEAWSSRGTILQELGRPREAIESFDRALAISPSHVPSLHNRANAFNDLKRKREAMAGYEQVLAIEPDNTLALNGRAGVLQDLKRFDEALSVYERVFSLNPHFPYIQGWRVHAKMHVCNWSNLADDIKRIIHGIDVGNQASTPYVLLAADASAPRQLKAAQIFCREKYPASSKPVWRGETYHHRKVRIGYISGEFHEQATAHLTADLYECHDRSAFELYAFATGKNDGSAMRRRLETAFDLFLDVSNRSDREIAELIHRSEIDILVNLNGYFGGERTKVFAMRPAPTQVNYLGYPGTMGAPYLDYIIADKIVIPADQRQNYLEKVVYLPHTYQPNDRKKQIAERTFTRFECGLPEHGFVFCCFNNNFKITPEIFDLWMRLLRRIEGSVLWLYQGNGSVKHNLVAEALKRGVAAGRIIFAPFVPLSEHLSRLRLADLVLDTLPCNAHTTASDALWCGVPVLTCVGSTFAGRVAASLLTAVGLPELITHSLDEYEALALRIAREPVELAVLKGRLAQNRGTTALFDTPRYARGLEAAYRTMWERYRRGEPPASFGVDWGDAAPKTVLL